MFHNQSIAALASLSNDRIDPVFEQAVRSHRRMHELYVAGKMNVAPPPFKEVLASERNVAARNAEIARNQAGPMSPMSDWDFEALASGKWTRD